MSKHSPFDILNSRIKPLGGTLGGGTVTAVGAGTCTVTVLGVVVPSVPYAGVAPHVGAKVWLIRNGTTLVALPWGQPPQYGASLLHGADYTTAASTWEWPPWNPTTDILHDPYGWVDSSDDYAIVLPSDGVYYGVARVRFTGNPSTRMLATIGSDTAPGTVGNVGVFEDVLTAASPGVFIPFVGAFAEGRKLRLSTYTITASTVADIGLDIFKVG